MGATAATRRYETIRPIASGGMATVYLGRTVGLGGFERLVAIKKMHPHIAQEADFVSMFLDEARLAASIRHPNVIPTIDVDQGPDGLFLVMEYVEGASLLQVLRAATKRQERLPLPVVLRIILDVLAGLQAAHELVGADGQPLNLVHRDISPQNVLVGVDGGARILDFGVARAEARISSTRGSMLKGKVSYMSPEQLTSQPIDARADVYSAGVVLWEMLTGRRLFKGDDAGMLMANVSRGPSETPRALVPNLPPAIDEACMAALQPVDHRLPSAAAFSDALDEAASLSGIVIASARVVGQIVKDSMSASPISGGTPSFPPGAEGTPSHARPISVTSASNPPDAAAIANTAAIDVHFANTVATPSSPIPSIKTTLRSIAVDTSQGRAETTKTATSKVAITAIAAVLGLAVIGVFVLQVLRITREDHSATGSVSSAAQSASAASAPSKALDLAPPPATDSTIAPASPATGTPPLTASPAASPSPRPRAVVALPVAPVRVTPPPTSGKFHPLEP